MFVRKLGNFVRNKKDRGFVIYSLYCIIDFWGEFHDFNLYISSKCWWMFLFVIWNEILCKLELHTLIEKQIIFRILLCLLWLSKAHHLWWLCKLKTWICFWIFKRLMWCSCYHLTAKETLQLAITLSHAWPALTCLTLGRSATGRLMWFHMFALIIYCSL